MSLFECRPTHFGGPTGSYTGVSCLLKLCPLAFCSPWSQSACEATAFANSACNIAMRLIKVADLQGQIMLLVLILMYVCVQQWNPTCQICQVKPSVR